MGKRSDIDRMLEELHASYLKENKYDEGDPIYYRINYRLEDAFDLTREEAEKLHSDYHTNNPRQVSQGYCENCKKVITIIPVIYGIQESDLERMKAAENAGRIIVGDTGKLREGSKVAMFGCKECRSLLPRYGML